MKAIQIKAYGGAEQLSMVDVPIPPVEAGQVLVRIQASSFNPIDAKIASGLMRQIFPQELPYSPGGDFSGIIDSLGEGVEGLLPGDEVYGYPVAGGAYAEFIAIAADKVAFKPRSISHNEAASLAIVGQTAVQMLDRAKVTKRTTVLIQGAGGAVGSIAVQLAHDRGAVVIGTTSSGDINRVRSYGADRVLDYTTTRSEDTVKDVDVVLDTVGGEVQQRSYGVLRPGGTLVTITRPPSPEEAERHHVCASMLIVETSSANLTALAEHIDSQKIIPFSGKVYPLRNVARRGRMSSRRVSKGRLFSQLSEKERSVSSRHEATDTVIAAREGVPPTG